LPAVSLILEKRAAAEPAGDLLDGYRLLEVIGRTPLAEAWKARSPEGRLVCVKYVNLSPAGDIPVSRMMQSARRLLDMRHPHLLAVHSLSQDAGRLVLVTDLADQTLYDRFQDCWSQGSLYGIPRDELLEYLTAAAQALDYLRNQHNLQHLALSPRTLLLVEDELLVSDYGLVQLLWLPAGIELARINPRYAAPELFEGRISGNSDQYSLAVIYQEMLTGRLPQQGHSSRDFAELRLRGEVDVSPLPVQDREAVRRALHREPCERFPSCSEFVSALRYASLTRAVPTYLSGPVAAGPLLASAHPAPVSGDSLRILVERLVASACQVTDIGQFGRIRWVWTSDGYWQHRCAALLAPGMAQEKLRAFAQRWNARTVHLDETSLVFQLHLASGLWGRLWKRKEDVLEVQVLVGPPRPPPALLSDVTVRLRFLAGDSPHQRSLIEQVGPVIADELHGCFMAPKDRRDDERFPFARPLYVAPAEGDASAFRIQCVGKDISLNGIGFYTPMEPPTRQVLIYQTSSVDQALFALPAAVTRVQRGADGWYEAGARFLVPPASSAS
jgi:hypothetical protein